MTLVGWMRVLTMTAYYLAVLLGLLVLRRPSIQPCHCLQRS